MIRLVDSAASQLEFGIEETESGRLCLHFCGTITVRADGRAQPREILLGRMLKDMRALASDGAETSLSASAAAQRLRLKTEFLDFVAQLFLSNHNHAQKTCEKSNDSSDSDSESTETYYAMRKVEEIVSMIRAAHEINLCVSIGNEALQNSATSSISSTSVAQKVAETYKFKFSAPAA